MMMGDTFTLGGDPAAIRGSAGFWSTFSSAAGSASTDIKGMDSSEFIGDEADTYRGKVNDDLSPHLDTTSQAWGIVSTALSHYSTRLEWCQQELAKLKTQYVNQQQVVSNAQSAVSSAKSADSAEHNRATAATDQLKPGETLPPSTYVSATSGAQSRLTEAQSALDNIVSAANKIRSDHKDAVDTCCREIDRAKDMRFEKPPGFWGRLKNSVVGWVKDHADILTKISGVLKVISGIAGMLAMIPILAPIMGPIALVAGGAALAIDVTLKLATGQGSWMQIGLDALSMIPGARAAKLAFGANVGMTSYNVATGKASVTDLVMVVGLGAMSMRGNRGGRMETPGSNEAPRFAGTSTRNAPSEPQFVGMPTHVRTTGANGADRNRIIMPTRSGESVSVPSGVGGNTTTTVTRTATGHQVTVDNGGPNVLNTHLPEGSNVHFGDGTAPAASSRTATPALPANRSPQPYAANGVRVSRDPTQNAMAEQTVRDMNAAGMSPRVDQGQVAANGNGYPNRPDVNGTLNGQQTVNAEYDRVGSGGSQGARVNGHVERILAHDPGSILFTVPSP